MCKKIKKILFFIKVPPPTTGATLMNLQVSESRLLRSEYDIREIKISYANHVKEIGKLSFRKLKIVLKTLRDLRFEVKHMRPDLIYFQLSPFGFGFYRDLLYITVIKKYNIKILFHLHGKGIKNKVKNPLHLCLYRYAFKKTKVICLSKLIQDDIKEVHDGSIYIVNNGIPDITTCVQSSFERTRGRPPRLLFISNLNKSKGIYDYLTALDLLNKNGFKFSASIVGAEKDLNKDDLEKVLYLSGLHNIVKYHGPKYGNDKDEIYRNSDVVVFPTLNDAWGNIILEAMQHGKPVIATDEGSIPEIIDDGVTGFIVQKNSPDQIAERIKYLMNNSSLLQSMGNAGREKFLNKYTVHHFENNLLKVFQKIL